MAILQASKVIVDESSLTGEIHPIAKTPLDPASSQLAYNLSKNKTSTLFAGTTILECGTGSCTEGDLAVVTKTGSFTVKGQLLSDILSYERHKFKFDDEVKIVLAILVAEAIVMVALVAFFSRMTGFTVGYTQCSLLGPFCLPYCLRCLLFQSAYLANGC
jgi:magnesium-transporting ATPase (P-type)